ncbi:hypothetical protein FKM82_025827 [Ascaphus truei]
MCSVHFTLTWSKVRADGLEKGQDVRFNLGWEDRFWDPSDPDVLSSISVFLILYLVFKITHFGPQSVDFVRGVFLGLCCVSHFYFQLRGAL